MSNIADHERHIKALQSCNDGAGILTYWKETRKGEVNKGLDIAAIRSLLDLKETDLASVVIDSSFVRYPNDFYLSVLQSALHLVNGDTIEAFRSGEVAVRLDPMHLMTQYAVGLAAIRLRKAHLACNYLMKSLRLFLDNEFRINSLFPLQCLLRIYAIMGPPSASVINECLKHLSLRDHAPFIEISPFLERMSKPRKEGGKRTLAYVARDKNSYEIYRRQEAIGRKVPKYSVIASDLSLYHLCLKGATVSASFGAVWTEESCFALDHGFHSSLFHSEYDIEGKIILTQDEAILGFSIAEQTIELDVTRKTISINADLLILPPCHHVNFGHFVHDILSLKYAYDRLKLDWPALRPALLRPFPNDIFKTAFEATFGPSYVVFNDPTANCKVRSAHLVSLPHSLWPDQGAICIGPARYLLKHLRSLRTSSHGVGRKVFIARTVAFPDGVSIVYKKLCEDFGFESVAIEQLSQAEYFKLFANATHIAGLHGAGLMNFPFAPEGVRLAEFKRPGGNWHSIATFASVCEVDIGTFELEEPDEEGLGRLYDEFRDWMNRR
jgi:hypothetical protein